MLPIVQRTPPKSATLAIVINRTPPFALVVLNSSMDDDARWNKVPRNTSAAKALIPRIVVLLLGDENIDPIKKKIAMI